MTPDGCCKILLSVGVDADFIVRSDTEYHYSEKWYHSLLGEDGYETYVNVNRASDIIYYYNGVWYVGVNGLPQHATDGTWRKSFESDEKCPPVELWEDVSCKETTTTTTVTTTTTAITGK